MSFAGVNTDLASQFQCSQSQTSRSCTTRCSMRWTQTRRSNLECSNTVFYSRDIDFRNTPRCTVRNYFLIYVLAAHPQEISCLRSFCRTRSIHSVARTIRLRSCDQREQEQEGDYNYPRSTNTKLRLRNRLAVFRVANLGLVLLPVGIHFHRGVPLGNQILHVQQL
ncbi:hypothetical protein B0H13DRAFT_1866866 [Mycena leptocephala]|nr:hypothetical protein B0H13DRAFT_1866866 [Mycena leptocephala]